MFLKSYLTSNNYKKKTIDNLYRNIIQVSRKKIFYQKLEVPDTFDGRFDMLVLFSVVLFHALSRFKPNGPILSQSLFDKIFLDLDFSLRELGAGDAGVNIKIKSMVNCFMGRQKKYCISFQSNNFVQLEKSIIRNVYRNVQFSNVSPHELTNYCKKILFVFNKKEESYFLKKHIIFPDF